MLGLYASITGTTVLQIRAIPKRAERPYYAGQVMLFSYPGSLQDETSLRSVLCRFGQLHFLHVAPRSDCAHMAFITEEAAAACILNLTAQGWHAVHYYDDTPFSLRGWCVWEDSVSMFVLHQLAAAAEQHALPTRYQLAQRSRAKVIDLAGEPPRPRDVVSPPEKMLEQAIQQLESARFSFEPDCISARKMLVHFDWLVKASLQQAQLDPRTNTTDPNHSLRLPRTGRHPRFHGMGSSLNHHVIGVVHGAAQKVALWWSWNKASLHGHFGSARVYTTTGSSPRDAPGLSLADLHMAHDRATEEAATEDSELDAATPEDSREQLFDSELDS